MPEINVTIPTNMLFGTFDKDSSAISSENYEIVNNAQASVIKIEMWEFQRQAGSSSTALLDENTPNPSSETDAARLYLYVNNSLAINSLTETTENKDLMILSPNEKTTLNFDGQYFGNLTDNSQTEHQMKLKFSVVPSLTMDSKIN